MINLGRFSECVCKAKGNPHKLCDGELSFEEKGKKVKLTPKQGELAKALAVDGCIFTDEQSRCDGLFILQQKNKHFIVMVELKGTHIQDAFGQLAYMKYHRTEYQELIGLLKGDSPIHVTERAFIVSNYIPTKREMVDLERTNKIRVNNILHSEATKPIPDLRKYFK